MARTTTGRKTHGGRIPVRTPAHNRNIDACSNGDTPAAAAPPDISNLDACIEDTRRAGINGDTGPVDPTEFHNLRGRLASARMRMPPLYREEFVDPYIATLDQI